MTGALHPLDTIRAYWPREDLDYLRLLATTALALMLLPLILFRLIRNPIAAADLAVAGAVK